MSYILDALRKADAQRERDPARGIHAQSVPVATAPPAARVPRALLALLALAALVAALAAWLWLRPDAAPRVELARAATEPQGQMRAGSPAVPAAAGAVGATAPGVASSPAPTAGMAPQSPAAQVLPAPDAPLLPASRSPAPRELPRTPAAATGARQAIEAPTGAASSGQAPSGAAAAAIGRPGAAPKALPAPAPAPAPSAAAAPAASAVTPFAELPADVQRDVPKLAISGGVYSDNASQRMLIINGQVFNEGAEPAPGVVLEQIRARTAVLRFRGYRYSVGF